MTGHDSTQDITLVEFTVEWEVDAIHQRVRQIMHNCDKCHEGKSLVKTQIVGTDQDWGDSGYQDTFHKEVLGKLGLKDKWK